LFHFGIFTVTTRMSPYHLSSTRRALFESWKV
jgi:hypothetical protein